ncbi:MAG TPA: F0F1 ATP synthase subunit B [Candidatus Limnocylindria bacterium]|jgi:F-type H+-transporting ATPase subunit b|nr:F0F1 ATP synthase subunit B [Candidatus Limnocylindria bacterium]
MNLPLLFAAADTGNPVVDLAHQFGVTWQLLISQIILFVIVALALKKFAYAPILDMLEQRRERIAKGLADAEKSGVELAKAQAAAQEILTKAGTQANKIIEDARAASAKISETERQKAIAEASDILAKARQVGDAELARLKGELRKEFGKLVVAATAKVSGKILTFEDQQRLAEETNRQIAA